MSEKIEINHLGETVAECVGMSVEQFDAFEGKMETLSQRMLDSLEARKDEECTQSKIMESIQNDFTSTETLLLATFLVAHKITSTLKRAAMLEQLDALKEKTEALEGTVKEEEK